MIPADQDRAALLSVAPVALEGGVVRLEPLCIQHVPALVAAANTDPAERFPFTTVHGDTAGMQSWVEEALRATAAGTAVPFATVCRSTGGVVGSTRFGNIERWEWPTGSRRALTEGADAVEIGWTWLARPAQRTGINTEAKLLMLRHAFERWGVYRVTLKTDARNTRSRAAIERLGARFEGALRSHMPAADGGVRDTAIFSVVRDDWPEVRRRIEALLADDNRPSRAKGSS